MAEPTDNDLIWALKALRDSARQQEYRLCQDYYDGEHRLRFATEKFRNAFGSQIRAFADNLCASVVDSVADRLKVTGVESESAADAATKAWEIWQRNRMDVRAPETHHESLLKGDGYALVWPDKSGQAVIWSLPASQMAVAYDPNQPGVLTKAVRLWQDTDGDQRIHLDLYYADRVARYVSKKAPRSYMPSSWRDRDFEVYVTGENDVETTAVLENRWGRVPVFHFPNRRYHCYGVSELQNVVPLQDALNKAACDMLVAMEFSAFPQRWATGVDAGTTGPDGKPVAPPWDMGEDRILTVGEPDARFGVFASTDLTQYVEVQENLRSEIARVSGTPLHYLFITRGDFPSGEAMKSAEARFTRKVENRQTAYGNQWEDLLALALRMEGGAKVEPGELSLEWESASPLALETGEPTAESVPPPDMAAAA